MNPEILGDRLRKAREHARMSQVDAAQQLDVTPAALSQYEAGKRRVDALLLDKLSRIYGVPVRFFFGEQGPRTDWEETLRVRAEGLSSEGKAGISSLITKVHALEELFEVTRSQLPQLPHPPFPALPDRRVPDDEAAERAEQVRRHFDLGMAPLQNIREFLDAIGFLVFAIPFGSGDSLSGLYFTHPTLGRIVALNEEQAYSRIPHTLAHELGHGLFHYDRPAVLSRYKDTSPVELFADRFATHFLIPGEALHERLRTLDISRVDRPEIVVRLARYFGVSYKAMLKRLKDERRLIGSWEAFEEVKPIVLAKSLGYRPLPYEFGLRPLPIEERVPRVALELAMRAVGEGQLSLRRAAEMLGASYLELEDLLDPSDIAEMLAADE